jgi:hypothetical protein
MNEREFERTARAWLDDGPTRMSDRAVLSALEEIHTTRQRRTWWPARRATPVSIYLRAAIAAVLVVGIGLVAINVLPRGSDTGVGGEPTANPSPSASPSPSAAEPAAIPELTETHVSPFNGFSIGYPADAQIVPAKVISRPGVEQNNDDFDFIHTESYSVRGASAAVPESVSGDEIDAYVDQQITGYQPGGCGEPRREQAEVTIDGQLGRVSGSCPNEIEATVEAGGRLYVFTVWGDDASRALFDAYAATIDLRPEDGAIPSTSPSP